MKSTADSIIESLQAASQVYISTFQSLSEAELNWKPAADSWSIAQIMEHIIITNQSYYPTFEKIKAGENKVPVIASLSFVPRFFGKMIINGLRPDNQKKTKTFPIWEPTKSSVGNIVERFRKHHDTFYGKLKELDPFFGQDIIISSPASKYVVYSLEAAFDIIIVHEQRHYQQALRVQGALHTK